MMLSRTIIVLLLSRFGLGSPASDRYGSENSTLKWAPCNLDFPTSHQQLIEANRVPLYCANLKVPLDYTNEKNGKTIDLQLIKVEATKEPFKGSVIFNPGGPGGSGVDEVSREGHVYRDVFGGHFNVIGFDARGTGRTMPFACQRANATSPSLAARSTNFTIPQADMYSLLEDKAWNDGGLFVKACANTKGNADIARYLGTPFVARDMLKIVDALGEDGQLRFWGRSYSTVLGQTFAAMFPKRVGRVLLDSVLRADDYFSGHWLTANRHTEVALLNFFREYINAGTKNCPIANFTGPNTTPEALHKETAKSLQELLDNSTIVPKEFQQALTMPWWQPGTTVYQELKYRIFASLYYPSDFAALYVMIDALLKRDWLPVIRELALASSQNSTAPPEIPWNLGANALHGIACSDAAFRAQKPKDMYSLVQAQAASGSFSDAFAPQLWPCSQWPFRAAEQFNGPFSGINTSYPILMVNSAQDPVTPLSGAWEASANLLGSRLLVHNGHGHGLMNHPSNCTIKAIHDYFNDGKLPEVGTVCEPNQSAFEVLLETVAELTDDNVLKGRDLTPRWM